MVNFYQLALDEWRNSKAGKTNGRRVTDATEQDRAVILARAKELQRRAELPSTAA